MPPPRCQSNFHILPDILWKKHKLDPRGFNILGDIPVRPKLSFSVKISYVILAYLKL